MSSGWSRRTPTPVASTNNSSTNPSIFGVMSARFGSATAIWPTVRTVRSSGPRVTVV